jgi:hypothetical protein
MIEVYEDYRFEIKAGRVYEDHRFEMKDPGEPAPTTY